MFHNEAKNFLVWVNEENQLRMTAMQKGGDLPAVFARWAKGVKGLEDALSTKGKKFMYDDHIGIFSSCVSNVGTGLRISLHMLLPKTLDQVGLDTLAAYCKDKLAVICRATPTEGRVDISNKATIGKSEVELVQGMTNSICSLIEMEKKAVAGDDVKKLITAA
jgi:creatine kinase